MKMKDHERMEMLLEKMKDIELKELLTIMIGWISEKVTQEEDY